MGIRLRGPSIAVLTTALLAAYLLIHLRAEPPSLNAPGSIELVVASLQAENTSWLTEHLPHLPARIYIADDPAAPLTVPENKGRESAVYLTHIINNYDRLARTTFFIHSHRYQWHNEDPLYDGVPVLKNFRPSYVQEHGWASLRCSWEPGCPNELEPDLSLKSLENDTEADDRHKTQAAYAPAFQELFPELSIPKSIGVHCGAQFAVHRDTIRRRPRSDYVRYRDWLYSTQLPDYLSGRILEYSWHIMFGKDPVDCPHAGQCFCDKFGLCGLKCVEHSCEKRYKFVYGVLPDRWPQEGPGTEHWPARDWAD